MNDKDNEFTLARYSALIELWIHHNTDQLQWPAVMIGAALIVIPIVASSYSTKLVDVNLWGRDLPIALGAGLPFVITGTAMLVMQYLMKRSRKITAALEEEILKIENNAGKIQNNFKVLNHQEGFSGSLLIRLYMIVIIALPLNLLGFSFLVGPLWGSVIWMITLLIWWSIENYPYKFVKMDYKLIKRKR